MPFLLTAEAEMLEVGGAATSKVAISLGAAGCPVGCCRAGATGCPGRPRQYNEKNEAWYRTHRPQRRLHDLAKTGAMYLASRDAPIHAKESLYHPPPRVYFFQIAELRATILISRDLCQQLHNFNISRLLTVRFFVQVVEALGAAGA